jgi:hypothetical protein
VAGNKPADGQAADDTPADGKRRERKRERYGNILGIQTMKSVKNTNNQDN